MLKQNSLCKSGLRYLTQNFFFLFFSNCPLWSGVFLFSFLFSVLFFFLHGLALLTILWTQSGLGNVRKVVIIITTTTTIIIITLKGAIRDFYNLLTAPRTVSNMYAQVARAQLCANHVQHIECLSHATCHVTCHMVRRDSSAIKFDRVEIAFIVALFYMAETINWWRRGGNRSAWWWASENATY